MFGLSAELSEACSYAAVGFLPGLLIGGFLWFWLRRKASMPLFYADIISLVAPILVWCIMNRYHWTLVGDAHSHWQELMLLGWVWSICFIARMLIPHYTHKLRFRLAAIHVGSIAILAAVLLGLFFPGFSC